jgi:hypothetical protein
MSIIKYIRHLIFIVCLSLVVMPGASVISPKSAHADDAKAKRKKRKKKRRKKRRKKRKERALAQAEGGDHFAREGMIHLSGAFSVRRTTNQEIFEEKIVDGAETYLLDVTVSPRIGYMITPDFELAGELELQLTSTDNHDGDNLSTSQSFALMIDPAYYVSMSPHLHPYIHTAVGYRHMSVQVGDEKANSFGGLSLRPGLGLAFTSGKLKTSTYVIRIIADFQYDRLSGDRKTGRDLFQLHLGVGLGLMW